MKKRKLAESVSEVEVSNEGELPEGWKIRHLGKCVDILDNLRIPINNEERKSRPGSIPYYGATGQVGWINDFIFDEELLLLGEDGAPFYDKSKSIAYIITGKSWVNNHAHVLRAIKGLTSNQYLMYYLNSFDFSDYITGSTRDKLNQSAMRKIPVVLPPLAEQQRIVARVEALLANVNAARERLQRVPLIMKKFRQAVLAAACEGRLTEGWRGTSFSCNTSGDTIEKILKETQKVNSKNKKQLKTELTKWETPESLELPEIPEVWHWVAVKNLTLLIQYGISVKGEPDETNGIPILRMGNIQEGLIDLTDLKFIPSNTDSCSNFIIEPGDILFNRTNSPELVGKSAVVHEKIRAVFASYLIRVRPNGDLILSDYLCWWINSRWGREWAQTVKTDGVSQSNINAQKLSVMPVPLPPLAEQHEIVRRVEALFARADAVEREVAAATKRADALTQAILAKAFAGKL